MKIVEIWSTFATKKNVFLSNFGTFPNFSKFKALEDFLISFLEIVHLMGCLGGISQNSNFWNWFEILRRFSIFSDIGSLDPVYMEWGTPV